MKDPGRLVRLLRILPDHVRTAMWGFFGHRGTGRDRVVVQAVITGPEGVVLSVRSDSSNFLFAPRCRSLLRT